MAGPENEYLPRGYWQIREQENPMFKRDLLIVNIWEEIRRQTTASTAQGRDQQSRICVKNIPVNSSDELEIGDQVVFHRLLYDHHGIIISKNGQTFTIIEAKKADDSNEGGKKQLACSEIIFDFEKDDVSVASYERRHSKQETASWAVCLYEEISKHPDAYQYDLFTNNCEHFATFCATGIMHSQQVADFKSLGFPSYIISRLKS